jgi:hypothetical protein
MIPRWAESRVDAPETCGLRLAGPAGLRTLGVHPSDAPTAH